MRTTLSLDKKKNQIPPHEPGFIDHSQLASARAYFQKTTNIGLSNEKTITTRSLGINPPQNNYKLPLLEDKSPGGITKSQDNLSISPKNANRIMVFPTPENEI
jgi:hypothetical protein